MNDNQLYAMNLKSRVISLEKTIKAYRSSAKFEELRHFHSHVIKEKDNLIAALKLEVHNDALHLKKTNREWMKANEEMCDAYEEQLNVKDKKINHLEKQLNDAYREANILYEKDTEYKATIQNLRIQLDDEEGKNAKLKAQINRDYENSGKPSSACRFHKKITNGREPSGKKQGGQKGHPGHKRKQYTPTNIIVIDTPDEYLNTDNYEPTGEIIKKQLVNLSIVVQVDEYQTAEFRCKADRRKVHAPFPKGLVNEMSFGASVECMAFLLNDHYDVSIDNIREFLLSASGGILSMSKGKINQLGKKFSKKTKKQRDEIFDELVKAPVLNTDFTTARVNGKQVQTLICSSGKEMMYYAREHKGHKGIENSPVAISTNTLVHDHEKAFYKYGSAHQECLVHCLRYLKNSIENEPHLSWNTRMYETIRKMIHYAKHTEKLDNVEVEKLIKEYDGNLDIACLNYQSHPPTKYYREGYNLYKRMKEYRDNHVLFLLKEGIPYDNNLSERLARVIKRKLNQMTTFRSFDSFTYTCDSLGIIETIRMQGGNLFEKVTDLFTE